MIVLLGTKPDFRVSESWMLDRTGLSSSSYKSARDALIKRGWITVEPYKSITVDIDAIYKCGKPIAAEGEDIQVLPISALGKATQDEIRKRVPIAAEGDKPIAASGEEPNTARGNAPIAAGPIINNTDTGTNNIINKQNKQPEGGGGPAPQQEPILVSRAQAQFYELSGNKLDWKNENEFYFNGRFCRVRDIVL